MSSATAKPSAFETIRPVVVLVSICMVAGALLGFVHAATEPVAQANAEKKAREVLETLVPEAKDFAELDCSVDGCTAALEAPQMSAARRASFPSGSGALIRTKSKPRCARARRALPVSETACTGPYFDSGSRERMLWRKLSAAETIRTLYTLSFRLIHNPYFFTGRSSSR